MHEKYMIWPCVPTGSPKEGADLGMALQEVGFTVNSISLYNNYIIRAGL